MASFRQAFVGVGANLGDRLATIRAAAESLRGSPHIRSFASSSLYETAPVGVLDQPPFLNAVFAVETDLPPEGLLGELQRLEQTHGRVRDRRWGPRTLDLDLLLFADETRATADLTLPHPRLFERAFAVVPLRELLSRPATRERAPEKIVKAVESTIVDERGVAILKDELV
jgi:2-amino-4-hydroxy-6-hydroxymethyldihydropteridine diphosphokinase